MKKEIIQTADGSHTVAIPERSLTYHSVHGAIRESQHVFIEAGLAYLLDRPLSLPVRVFEMGFGTGLNAFLTAIRAQETETRVEYVAVENSPLSAEEASRLNFPDSLGHRLLFEQLHRCSWNEALTISEFFSLEKRDTDLADFSSPQGFQLIYYDAFAPGAQPELWTESVFAALFDLLVPGGLLVTYCAKGAVRRAMVAAGFGVEKLPGPPGKREMLRATKPAG